MRKYIIKLALLLISIQLYSPYSYADGNVFLISMNKTYGGFVSTTVTPVKSMIICLKIKSDLEQIAKDKETALLRFKQEFQCKEYY